MSVFKEKYLPDGCITFGKGASSSNIKNWLNRWDLINSKDVSLVLILAGTRTSEVEGISAAGSTPESRKYTAIADAELFLSGPLGVRNWPLPPLEAGVSPALISYVSRKWIKVDPEVLVVGLTQKPFFSHRVLESINSGPSECISTGNAMALFRVNALWERGYEIGKQLKGPLLLSECVPGGTTTAQAVLTGLGICVSDLISGSPKVPPVALKKALVSRGLHASASTYHKSPKHLLAAVGDPFQPVATGILVGALEAHQPVLLGGGSQMVAILALALASVSVDLQKQLIELVTIGTTSWLAEEVIGESRRDSSLKLLLNRVGDYFSVNPLGIASGLRFSSSMHKALRDYEIGYIKEGVGAGAFSLLAQLWGASLSELVYECDYAFSQLKERSLGVK